MRRLYWVAALSGAWACASQQPRQSLGAASPEATALGEIPGVEAVAHEDVANYVVSPGLRWLVLLRPAELLTNMRPLGDSLLPTARISAFERSVGLRLSSTPRAAIAGYDYSTLYVVRSTPENSSQLLDAAIRYRQWLSQPPVTRRVLGLTLYSGVHAGLPQHFLQLDGLTGAWSEGDPSTIKAAGLLAQNRLTTVSSALRGASLSLLPEGCHSGEVVMYLPGPIDEGAVAEPEGPSAVLSLILAAALRFTIHRDTLSVQGCIVGDWQGDGKARVAALLQQLMEHRFTSLLELSEAEKRATVSQSGELVEFTYEWPLAEVMMRVQAILELRLGSLLGGPSGDPESGLTREPLRR